MSLFCRLGLHRYDLVQVDWYPHHVIHRRCRRCSHLDVRQQCCQNGAPS